MATKAKLADGLRDLFLAVNRYAHSYLVDEAHDRECCVSDDQHAAAKDVFSALANTKRLLAEFEP